MDCGCGRNKRGHSETINWFSHKVKHFLPSQNPTPTPEYLCGMPKLWLPEAKGITKAKLALRMFLNMECCLDRANLKPWHARLLYQFLVFRFFLFNPASQTSYLLHHFSCAHIQIFFTLILVINLFLQHSSLRIMKSVILTLRKSFLYDNITGKQVHLKCRWEYTFYI